MRRYLYSLFVYYVACVRRANKGSFKFSHGYRWVIGGLSITILLQIFGYKMEIPSTILGGVVSGGILLSATWAIVFLGRLLLIAPFELHKDAIDKAKDAEKRSKELMANPDVIVTTTKNPIVIGRENVPEEEGKT